MASEEDLERLKEENEQFSSDDTASVDEQEYYDKLKDASTLLKNSSILFEFLATPELVKNLSNRERAIMLRQASKIDEMTDQLDELLEHMDVTE